MRKFRGIFKAFGFVLCIMICAIFVAAHPMQFAYATENGDDFETFYSAFIDMMSNFEDEEIFLDEDEYVVEDGQVFVSESTVEKYDLKKSGSQIRPVRALQTAAGDQTTEDKFSSTDFCAIEELEQKNGKVVVDTRINRLIVNSPSKVDSFGAVAVAEFNDWHIFQYASHQEAQDAYEQLSNSGINVEFDFVVKADDPVDEDFDAVSNSTDTHNSWADEFVGYDAFTRTTMIMHEQSALPEIIVAVIDSGIYADHELFQGRLWTKDAKSFLGESRPPMTEPYQTKYDYQDLNGHGTHVSGTIVEFTQPNVKILPLKVLNWEGKGKGSMIVAALNYVITLKKQGLNIKVANMSIGIDLSGSDILAGYADLTIAVRDAKAAGVVSVVAAGNESRNTIYSSPACIEEAFTVSALTKTTNQFGVSSLNFDSSYSNFGSHVDFCAPGTRIKSAGLIIPSNYAVMSGTSMATPHVSAAVALVLTNPFYADYSIDQIYDLLRDNATDLGDKGRDDLYGNGCINLENIGVERTGEVEFSEKDKIQTAGEIFVTLDYDNNNQAEIVYAFSKTDLENQKNCKTYVQGQQIRISSTTQIWAVAYVKDYENKILRMSELSSMTYYFDNVDLLSNFEFSAADGGYEISKYLGQDLATLDLSSTFYNNRSIVGVGAYAFADSRVQNLILPKSLKYVGQSAFSGNSNLQEVHCASSGVEVRSYAFNRCKNLQTFDVPNVTSVGSYAFAYCENIQELSLLQATEIGLNALSGSGIKELYLREGVALAEQSELALDHVYGFKDENTSSSIEDFAHKFKGDFVNLKLRILYDLNATILVRNGESANFGLNFAGYDVDYDLYLNGQLNSQNCIVRPFGDGLDRWLMVTVLNLTNPQNSVKIRLTDGFGNHIDSREMEIDVISNEKETFAMSKSGEHFSMLVKDEKNENVTDSQNFYKSAEYMVEVDADNGYVLENVLVSEAGGPLMDVEYSPGRSSAKFRLSNVEADVSVQIFTIQKETLTITFDMEDCAEIQIDGRLCEGQSEVKRNSNASIQIKPFEGFEVSRVLVDGEKLKDFEEDQGVIKFEISNIVQEMTIEIFFNEISYKVNVSLGKGGSLSTNGDMQEDISFWQTRQYHINANEGYSIDTVTVNGQAVEVKDGNFEVSGKAGDCDIVVSFKKSDSIFENGSIGLVYFFIFLTLLFVFMMAKIVLSLIRKNQKKKRDLRKYQQK